MTPRYQAGNARQPATRHGDSCWSRLSRAPWRSLAFGDDLESFAFLLVLALLLLPLLGRFFPLIILALAGVFLARAWLWCRAAAAVSESHPGDRS